MDSLCVRCGHSLDLTASESGGGKIAGGGRKDRDRRVGGPHRRTGGGGPSTILIDPLVRGETVYLHAFVRQVPNATIK